MQVSESVRERQGDSAEPKLPKLVSQGDLLGLKDQLVQQAGVIIVWNYVSGGESCTTSPLIECFMECGPLKGRLIKFNRNKCSLLGMSLQKADLLYVFKQNDLVFCDVAGSFLQSIFKPLKLGQISFAEVFATILKAVRVPVHLDPSAHGVWEGHGPPRPVARPRHLVRSSPRLLVRVHEQDHYTWTTGRRILPRHHHLNWAQQNQESRRPQQERHLHLRLARQTRHKHQAVHQNLLPAPGTPLSDLMQNPICKLHLLMWL